jgi:hypothetical protein
MLTPRSDRPDRDGPSSTRAKRRSDRCRSFRYRRNNALEYADPESRRRAKCNTVRLTSVILDTSSSRFRGVSGSAGSSHHRRLLYAQMNRLTLARLPFLILRNHCSSRQIGGLRVLRTCDNSALRSDFQSANFRFANHPGVNGRKRLSFRLDRRLKVFCPSLCV